MQRGGTAVPGGDPRTASAADYWDRVASAYGGGRPPLWRVQSDIVNCALAERWLLRRRVNALLKTDLFDEVAGTGLYPLLAARCDRAVAIDVSPAVVQAARARLPQLRAQVADVRSLPFESQSFDAVLSNSTLDHFALRSEVAEALRELARVLRPGGTLLITLDNPWNPLIALRDRLPTRLARRLRGVGYDSGWTCGPRALRRLLEEAGFEVRETTAVVHLPRVLVAFLDRHQRARVERWSGLLHAAEGLERWPTRFLTGHFVAALATRGASRETQASVR